MKQGTGVLHAALSAQAAHLQAQHNAVRHAAAGAPQLALLHRPNRSRALAACAGQHGCSHKRRGAARLALRLEGGEQGRMFMLTEGRPSPSGHLHAALQPALLAKYRAHLAADARKALQLGACRGLPRQHRVGVIGQEACVGKREEGRPQGWQLLRGRGPQGARGGWRGDEQHVGGCCSARLPAGHCERDCGRELAAWDSALKGREVQEIKQGRMGNTRERCVH